MMEEQNEKLETIDDWRDSAEKKLKQIKDRMDELGPEVGRRMPLDLGIVWFFSVDELRAYERCQNHCL